MIPTRWSNHRQLLRAGKHHSRKLQRAWTKHGEAAFSFDVLELCDEDQAEAREQHWIETLSAFGNGYNMRPEAGKQGRLSEETKRLIGDAQRRCATKPELVASRSERAKRLHAEGRIGRAAWSPEQRADIGLKLKAAWARRKAREASPAGA